MTLHLASISKHVIKIVEQWRLDVFMIYLQDQVTSFTKGVAVTMSNVRWFTHNITPIISPLQFLHSFSSLFLPMPRGIILGA